MSTTTEPAPGGSPDTTALDTSSAAPLADPPQPPKPPASTTATDADKVRMTPAQFKERQEEAATAAQRKLLKDLGFEKPEDAKSALARLQALENEKLSEGERLAKQLKELQAAVDSSKPLAGLASEAVGELLATLPEAQRKAIEEEAGDNPAEKMRLVRIMRKLAPPAASHAAADVAAGQSAAAPSTTTAAPLPPAPPATTALPPGAPRQSAVKSKWDQWQEKVSRGDRTADLFYTMNARAIEASRPH